MPHESRKPNSAFSELGFRTTIKELKKEIQKLYHEDQVPWVVGYSGGKDSTATLQLVWYALQDLPPEDRTKPVYVISTDTLVENPIVSNWVEQSLDNMEAAAHEKHVPVRPRKLTPDITDTFWVNLIGKGYPAPRPKFRWCTERLKINPSTEFIRSVVQSHGEAILVLGTRKAESAARARVMERFEQKRVRDKLSPNGDLPNSFVYSPIEDWTNDDVWMFLMQEKNPWGYENKDLLTMYQGASEDSECPVQLDTSKPSCGDSRFGCWVCTLVEKDKSMQAMIQNDEEKEWMLPLLEIRNKLDFRNNPTQDDRHLRDFRRMNGSVQLFHDRPIPGPYTQEARGQWLRELLRAQQQIRKDGPESVRDIRLISVAELEEIRRIWVVDKHEIEDRLPLIYKETTAEEYPGRKLDDNLVFGASEMEELRDICGDDDLHYQLVRELLSVERRYSSMLRRAGLFDAIERAFRKHFYESEEDAIARARRLQAGKEAAESYDVPEQAGENTGIHSLFAVEEDESPEVAQ